MILFFLQKIKIVAVKINSFFVNNGMIVLEKRLIFGAAS